jgi:hypothetical protein
MRTEDHLVPDGKALSDSENTGLRRNPRWFQLNQPNFFGKNGGDDETRTRDLCRDSARFFGICLKLRGTDGYQDRALEPQVTEIGPGMDQEMDSATATHFGAIKDGGWSSSGA